MNPLAPALLAALACGQAIGQQIETPPELRLRLYAERADLRWSGPIPRPEPAPRIGIELKLAPSFAPGLTRGTLLRAALNGSTHLSLRAYRGGLGVMLNSEY
jgi:hypothetical protein